MNAVLLTHGDLDGMVSAILVLKSLPACEASIRIANGRTLGKELRDLVARTPPAEQVFITDIPLLADHAAEVLAGIRELAKRGGGLHLYDHHLGWEAAAEVRSCFAAFCVDTSKPTAAALVWRERCRDIEGSQEWLRLLSEKDKSESPQIRERFGLLTALMQPQNYGKTESVLKALAQGGDLLPEYRELANRHYSEQMKREKQIAERAEILVAKSGRQIGWIDLRREKGFLLVSREVAKMHGVEVVGSVIRGAVLLGGSSIDQGVDLSFLHGEHTEDGVRLRVTGHKSPVRIERVGPDADEAGSLPRRGDWFLKGFEWVGGGAGGLFPARGSALLREALRRVNDFRSPI